MHRHQQFLQKGSESTTEIAVWEDDPMSVPSAYTVRVPALELDTWPLAIAIAGEAPAPAIYAPGTEEFRYWTAAAALGRAVGYWSDLLPNVVDWEVGPTLPVRLDAGVDLNAYYAREEDQKGLSFFHKTINGVTVYSGESSDIICHEVGHAILDTIRPDLFDAASDEIAAFHESFADISAVLSGLQLKSLREAVLTETNGDLHRSSRLSRLAEQLGWAIRQVNPEKADLDCLRNAVNPFLYQDPTILPAFGPSWMLTSDPHSFSRIFTGSFFDALASMAALEDRTPTEGDLLQVSQDVGKLLVSAVLVAPASSDFYGQVAAYMLEADRLHFSGKYNAVLTSAFVNRGVLAPAATAMISPPPGVSATTVRGIVAPERKAPTELLQVALSAANYGLRSQTLLVNVPGASKRFSTAAGTFKLGMMASHSAEEVAKSFVDDLFQRGKVDVGGFADGSLAVVQPALGRKTHKLVQTPGGLMLARVLFE